MGQTRDPRLNNTHRATPANTGHRANIGIIPAQRPRYIDPSVVSLQILTYKDGPRTERAVLDPKHGYSNEAERAN